MAFSKELEELIEAILTDGKIEDKERVALRKRAEKEGLDPDEVEVMVDSRLQERLKSITKEKSKGFKCPNCGQILPAMTAICPNCGQIVDTSDPSNKALANYIKKIESKWVLVKTDMPFGYPKDEHIIELEAMIRQGKQLYGDNKLINSRIVEVEYELNKLKNELKVEEQKEYRIDKGVQFGCLVYFILFIVVCFLLSWKFIVGAFFGGIILVWVYGERYAIFK